MNKSVFHPPRAKHVRHPDEAIPKGLSKVLTGSFIKGNAVGRIEKPRLCRTENKGKEKKRIED